MGKLLEEATVERGVDVRGPNGFIETFGCALRSEVLHDHCDPARVDLTGPTQAEVEAIACDPLDPDSPRVNIFAVITNLTYRARGGPVGVDKLVSDALDIESEKAAGVALFDVDDNGVSLQSPEVTTVAAAADTAATVAAALVDFWGRATGVDFGDTIVHLGVGRFLDLIAGEIKDGALKELGIRVAVSPGYPSDAVAVTGPVLIRLSTDQVDEAVNPRDNTAQTEASRLASIEFDPCIAVRVE